jgi:transposase
MCLYVRDLKAGEGQKLQSLLRRGKSVISVRRAQVILSSAQGMKVPAIARQVYLSEQYVRQIIERFNEDGLASLAPRYGGGRPAEITPEQKAEIVEIALMPPQILGLPFTQWSLAKLQTEVLRRKIVKSISPEWLRQILKEHKVSYQRTRTWKQSNDPQLEVKKNASKGSTGRRKKGKR